jgi:hypothetical protein
MTTHDDHQRRDPVTRYRCPECEEPVVHQPPTSTGWVTAWTASHGRELPEWSHTDGEPLCPVMGEHGYEPVQPVAEPDGADAGWDQQFDMDDDDAADTGADGPEDGM